MTNRPLGLDRAQYAPALQDAFLKAIDKPVTAFRGGFLPSGITPSALNVLDPSALVHAPYVLVSAGQYLGSGSTPAWLSKRSSDWSTVIGDSGGFQFINTLEFEGEKSCRQSLDWLETNSDLAMTLDIPTRAATKNPSKWSFDRCLDVTTTNNAFFLRHRTGSTRLLNVFQGRDSREVLTWYDHVSPLPFDGFAFGGATRDFGQFMKIICWLLRDGLLTKERQHLHVLGTSTPTVAVLLTAVQRELRVRLGLPDFRITFDTSSPSMLMANLKGVDGLTATPERLTLAQVYMPSDGAYRGKSEPFPFRSSAVGKLLSLGDLCASSSHVKGGAWDTFTEAMIVNHNIDGMLTGFEKACALADLSVGANFLATGGFRQDFMPIGVVYQLDAVKNVLRAPDPLMQLGFERSRLKLKWADETLAEEMDEGR